MKVLKINDRVLGHITIRADDVKVEETDEEPTPSVKKLGERPEDVMDTPDDWVIDFKTVEKEFPAIANTLKKEAFKGGAKQITVKKLKKILEDIEEDDDQFWVSIQDYSGRNTQVKWQKEPQVAIQLNISDKIRKALRENPVAADFFDDFFKMAGSMELHPSHTQTLAWARVYRFPDKWIIEEIQSDLFGESRKIIKHHTDDVKRLLDKYNDKEQSEITDFIDDKFQEWDKQLLGLIISMARKAGIKDIYMFDEDFKKSYMDNQLPGKGKMKRFYRVVPRDLGFRKGKLEGPDGQTYQTWHRAVATLLVA
jgi:hypothetical protein